MKQLVVIAKIVGETSSAVISRFRNWARSLAEGNGQPEVALREAIQFLEDVKRNAHEPPIVFFCEYLDMWSTGDLVDRVLARWDSQDKVKLAVNSSEVLCLPMLASASLAMERQTCSEQDEDRWFALVLREAVNAYSALCEKGVVVIGRRVTGASPTDAEITDAAQSVPQWMIAKVGGTRVGAD